MADPDAAIQGTAACLVSRAVLQAFGSHPIMPHTLHMMSAAGFVSAGTVGLLTGYIKC